MTGCIEMPEPITTALAGIALVKKSVEFVKDQIQTCNDIGDIIGHVDKALNGQQEVIKKRDKANVDYYATENIASEIIDAKIAQEQLYSLSQMIDARFGFGTWQQILQERKRRIDAKKKAIKEEKARRLKKQQDIVEYIKYGFIAFFTLMFLGTAIGITFKFFLSMSTPVFAHDPLKSHPNICELFSPAHLIICMNEGYDIAIDTAKAKLYEGHIDRPTPLSICRLKRETKIDDEDRECLYTHPDKSETKIIAPNRNGCPRNIYCSPR